MRFVRMIMAVGLINFLAGCVNKNPAVVDAVHVENAGIPARRGELEWITFTNVSFEMMHLNGGKVLLGSPGGEAMRSDAEGPALVVKVRPFRIGRTEVTQELFDLWRRGERDVQSVRIPGSDPREKESMALRRPHAPYYDPYSDHEHDDPQRPAGFMTPYCAQEFCKWLSVRTGRRYRLPTEAEWVYAARAGSGEAFAWGEGKADEYAWFGNERVGSRSHRVGENGRTRGGSTIWRAMSRNGWWMDGVMIYHGCLRMLR